MNFNFKTPKFWLKQHSVISLLLWPISIIYYIIASLRYHIQKTHKFKAKIICIGNATIGGSGKTPLAISIGKMLLQSNYKVVFVCKNYNSNITCPTKVLEKHSPANILDEAKLLAKIAPTYVSQNRLEAINMAEKSKPDFIIVDDGLQNNSFFKNISILVIDKSLELKNKFLFPAGPFRETLSTSIKKSDIIIYISKLSIDNNKKSFTATPKFILPKKTYKRYFAFTGIAFPDKFFKSLQELEFNIIKKECFPDHYCYKDNDLEKLLQQAKQNNLRLITTEKDIIKIPIKYQKNIDILQLSLEIKNQKKLLNTIKLTE